MDRKSAGDYEILHDDGKSEKIKVRICWGCFRADGSLFGTLVSVNECLGGSERMNLILNSVMKLLTMMYVDDIIGGARPGLAKMSSALVSLYLAVVGKPESNEKAQVQVEDAEKDGKIQEALVHLGMVYKRLPRLRKITLEVPGIAIARLREKMKNLRMMIRDRKNDNTKFLPIPSYIFLICPGASFTFFLFSSSVSFAHSRRVWAIYSYSHLASSMLLSFTHSIVSSTYPGYGFLTPYDRSRTCLSMFLTNPATVSISKSSSTPYVRIFDPSALGSAATIFLFHILTMIFISILLHLTINLDLNICTINLPGL